MIYSYTQCLEIYKTKYLLKKAVERGELFYIEKGIYSNEKYVSELQIISFKYPNAVFSMNSAFYYYNLTDVIPDKYYLVTNRGSAPISDKRVKQIFENSNTLNDGVVEMKYDGAQIRIYSRERMLVELIRNKNKLPFDYYKEILQNYRKILEDLDYRSIEDYAYSVPKTNMIMDIIRNEVF